MRHRGHCARLVVRGGTASSSRRPAGVGGPDGGRMRRILCREFGPVDRLALVEEPDPEPGPGEVAVAVEAAAVSFVDGLLVQGRYQVRPPLPYTPGTAVAGRVRSVGADVEGLAAGSPVVVLSMSGG